MDDIVGTTEGESVSSLGSGIIPVSDSSVFDLGNIINGSVCLKELTREEKLGYLKNPHMPSRTNFITQKVIKGSERKEKNLTFQASWLQKFKWLVHSEVAKGGLCKYCILFPPTDPRINQKGALVTKPFQNLAKACGKDGVLESHERLEYHKIAVEMGTTYVRAAENPTETLPYRIDESRKEIYERNFHILECIVKAIILCGKQNIAIRGHRDDSRSSESNKGNFLAILDLIAYFDETLKCHLESAKRNAIGTSKTVQNEVIDVIANYIRGRITAHIKDENAVFSIIADEVTDKYSNQEVLSICLRFLEVKDNQPHIREAFLDFLHIERTTGEKIAFAMKNSLAKHGVNISQARGQSYDGASNMSSARVGVQAEIKKVAPQALYTHCNSHVLNLSIVSACKLPSIRNMIDVLDSVFLFFNLSPKRQRLFERVLDLNKNKSKVTKLKGLCKTRWVERHTCFETFMELYSSIVITLEALLDPDSFEDVYRIKKHDAANIADSAEEEEAAETDHEKFELWTWDRETRVKAQGLLTSLKTSEHIVAFCVAKNALEVLKPLASKLQKKDQDVYQAYELIDKAIKRLETIRASIDVEFTDWFKEAEDLAEELSEEIKVKRVAGRQVHRANAASETPKEHFRRNLAIPFIDHLKQEMDIRFSKEDRVGRAIFSLLPHNMLNIEPELESCKNELLFWENDLETPTALLAELKEWVAHWKDQPNDEYPSNLLDCLEHADEDQFSNIRKLLVIGCTLPVGSAEAERSFSAFRRLKSYLRSTMSEDRLAGLALMHIHHDMDIDTKIICQQYIEKHNRRMFHSCLIKQYVSE